MLSLVGTRSTSKKQSSDRDRNDLYISLDPYCVLETQKTSSAWNRSAKNLRHGYGVAEAV